MKNNYTLDSPRRVCKQKIESKTTWKITEKSSLVGLIDYFRILKTIIILFLLYICMNNVPNQNVKVQEETLAKSNSDPENNIETMLFQNETPSF